MAQSSTELSLEDVRVVPSLYEDLSDTETENDFDSILDDVFRPPEPELRPLWGWSTGMAVLGMSWVVAGIVLAGLYHLMKDDDGSTPFLSDHIHPALLYIAAAIAIRGVYIKPAVVPSPIGLVYLLICVIISVGIYIGNFFLFDKVFFDSRSVRGLDHLVFVSFVIAFVMIDRVLFNHLLKFAEKKSDSETVPSIPGVIIATFVHYCCALVAFLLLYCTSLLGCAGGDDWSSLGGCTFDMFDSLTAVSIVCGAIILFAVIRTFWRRIIKSTGVRRIFTVLFIAALGSIILVFTVYGFANVFKDTERVNAMASVIPFVSHLFFAHLIFARYTTRTSHPKFKALTDIERAVINTVMVFGIGLVSYILVHFIVIPAIMTNWHLSGNNYTIPFDLAWNAFCYAIAAGYFYFTHADGLFIEPVKGKKERHELATFAKLSKTAPMLSHREVELLHKLRLRSDNLQFTRHEIKMLCNMIGFRTLTVAEIMTPRNVVFSFSDDRTVSDVCNTRTKTIRYSRIPVYHKRPMDIVGWVHRAQVLNAAVKGRGDMPISRLMQPCTRISEDALVVSVINAMIKKRTHLFIVVDEFSTFTGVVSLEDLLEELTGREFMDEYDTHKDMQRLAIEHSSRRLLDPSSSTGDITPRSPRPGMEKEHTQPPSEISSDNEFEAVFPSPTFTPQLDDGTPDLLVLDEREESDESTQSGELTIPRTDDELEQQD